MPTTSTSCSLTSLSTLMAERPAWAMPCGLPSRHTARAAMHVASMIDAGGSRTSDAQESYWHRATGGHHPPADLARGQALLVDVGLLVDDGTMLHPTPELTELLAGSADDALAAFVTLAAMSTPHTIGDLAEPALVDLVPDADRREQLLLQLARRHDTERQAAIGDAGERLVVAKARAELERLGRPDLAREVRRVSLTSDQLGYDVRAPCLQGPPRRLEVKATTSPGDTPVVEIFISRNEAHAGKSTDGWHLVVCCITDIDDASGSVLGWWSYDDLVERMPRDVDRGLWQQAKITLTVDDAQPGLPSAIL